MKPPLPVLAPVACLLAWAAVARAAPAAPTLRGLLERVPADSLVTPLKRYEATHGRGAEAAEAALALGQLHYARGEYRQAADAFTRAAARLEPARKPEARYWAGLSWLASGEPVQARAALEEAAQASSPRRAEALYAIATTWEAARRPERALESLDLLLSGNPGTVGAAALERIVALAPGLHHEDEAERARQRLLREYPNSIEAMRLAAVPRAETGVRASTETAETHPATVRPPARATPALRPASPSAHAAPAQRFALQIGAFTDLARARSLADAARRGGYPAVRIASLGDPAANLYAVRVGSYATPENARQAGARAARQLGVPWRVVPAP